MIAQCRKGIAAWRDVRSRQRRFLRADKGSVAIEYGLIAALVVIVIIVTLTQVRANLLSLPFPTLIAAFTGALS